MKITMEAVRKPKVSFNDTVIVHILNDDDDRRGPWMQAAADRLRFKRRINEIERIIGYIFSITHRRRRVINR
jgi:hypothetical protein